MLRCFCSRISKSKTLSADYHPARLFYDSLRENELAGKIGNEVGTVSLAWRNLVTAMNQLYGRSFQLPYAVTQPVTPISAVAHWLQMGIAQGYAKVARRESLRMRSDVLVHHGKVIIRPTVLNKILDKNYLARWPLAEVTAMLMSGPGFISMDQEKGRPRIILSDQYLNLAAFLTKLRNMDKWAAASSRRDS